MIKLLDILNESLNQQEIIGIAKEFMSSDSYNPNHDCKRSTYEFVNWLKKNKKFEPEVLLLAPPKDIEKFPGKSGDGDSHIFAIIDGYGVDFTANQFPGISEPLKITPENQIPNIYKKIGGYYTDSPDWFEGGKTSLKTKWNNLPSWMQKAFNEVKLLDIAKEVLNEDRCKRIADRKYDKPSAYKSGAIVRCRKGNIWKGLKEELSNVDYYKKLADLIIQKLPKIKPNFVRLWRGNRPNEVGKNPSYTDSLEGIALPFYYGYHEDGYDAVISYIDIPKEEAKRYIVGGGAGDSEIVLPKELLKNIQTVDKDIYKDFENQNIPPTVSKGGLTSFDDAIDKMFGETLNEVKKETLRTWFKRKGAPGKTGGWVDCNTCREVDGKKKCKPCGRKKGETRAKYPSCRPTPSQCGDPGKGKKWGKTK